MTRLSTYAGDRFAFEIEVVPEEAEQVIDLTGAEIGVALWKDPEDPVVNLHLAGGDEGGESVYGSNLFILSESDPALIIVELDPEVTARLRGRYTIEAKVRLNETNRVDTVMRGTIDFHSSALGAMLE